MENIYKCDLTGEVCEGEGLKQIDVDVSENLRLRVIPLVPQGSNLNTGRAKFVQGIICKQAEHIVEAALQGLHGGSKKLAGDGKADKSKSKK